MQKRINSIRMWCKTHIWRLLKVGTGLTSEGLIEYLNHHHHDDLPKWNGCFGNWMDWIDNGRQIDIGNPIRDCHINFLFKTNTFYYT